MTGSSSWKVARDFACGLMLLGVCALVHAAEPGPKTTKKPDLHKQVAVKFNHQHVTVLKRTAVPHKPFKMLHPETGKAVAHDALLKLPNGKQVKAGEYYAELNKLEKKLNALGHSLQDGKSQRVVLQQTTLDRAGLDAKARAVTTRHLAFNAKTMKPAVKRAELEAKHTQLVARVAHRRAALKKAPTGGAGKGTHAVKTWNYQVGKPSVISAFLEGKMEVKGSRDAVDVLGEAAAGGYLVNHRLELLKARAAVRVPDKGASSARLNVYVMGHSVYNLNKSVSTSWSKSDEISKSFDYSTKFNFMLGPIPMSVRFGAQGSAGVRYFVGIRPLEATAQIVPNARARAYAQAGIDIVIASAGVGGQLRLIDLTLRIGADVGVNHDSRGLYVHEHFYALSELEMLSGSLYVYAEVTVPRIGLPPWTKKHYEWDLWKWKGLKTKGYVFNIDKKTYLQTTASK